MSDRQQKPVAFALGLLGACVVVLIGIWRDISPEVILLRASVSGGAVAALAWVTGIVLAAAGSEGESKSTDSTR